MTTTPGDDDLKPFIPPWLRAYLDKLSEEQRQKFLTEYAGAIRSLIQRLAASPVNEGPDDLQRGKFSARIPGTNKFLNLKSSLWTALKYGAPLALAASLAPPLLAVLGIAVGSHVTLATVAGAGKALYDAFASLNPMEMDTYSAVAAAIERNKNKTLENSGASLPQIMESFQLDKQLLRPQDPEAMLKNLVDKKVLTQDASSGVSQYFLAF
jgi:hypothetical protein